MPASSPDEAEEGCWRPCWRLCQSCMLGAWAESQPQLLRLKYWQTLLCVARVRQCCCACSLHHTPAPGEEGCLLLGIQLVRCGGLIPWGAARDDQLVRCKAAAAEHQHKHNPNRIRPPFLCAPSHRSYKWRCPGRATAPCRNTWHCGDNPHARHCCGFLTRPPCQLAPLTCALLCLCALRARLLCCQGAVC